MSKYAACDTSAACSVDQPRSMRWLTATAAVAVSELEAVTRLANLLAQNLRQSVRQEPVPTPKA